MEKKKVYFQTLLPNYCMIISEGRPFLIFLHFQNSAFSTIFSLPCFWGATRPRGLAGNHSRRRLSQILWDLYPRLQLKGAQYFLHKILDSKNTRILRGLLFLQFKHLVQPCFSCYICNKENHNQNT